MSGRKYPKSFLDAMRSKSYTVESFGVEVEVRPIPDDSTPGVLDARDRAIEEGHWAQDIERQQSIVVDEPLSVTLERIRSGMGYANLNLNTKQMITKYETLSVSCRTVEIWRYFQRKSERAVRPAFVFFHGGGWIGGSVYTPENACKLIAELSDAVVFNIEYSLAPEYPYPAALEDCFAVVQHIQANASLYDIDPSRISIGGASAGANLSAALCLKARDLGLSLIHQQFLLYPVVAMGNLSERFFPWEKDAYVVSEKDRKYIEKRMRLGQPSEADLDSMSAYYVGEGYVSSDPYISPMCATSHAALPRTVIMVGEFDGLRQQGEYYGRLLHVAGCSVKVVRYLGCSHAFLNYLGLAPQAEDVCREIALSL